MRNVPATAHDVGGNLHLVYFERLVPVPGNPLGKEAVQLRVGIFTDQLDAVLLFQVLGAFLYRIPLVVFRDAVIRAGGILRDVVEIEYSRLFDQGDFFQEFVYLLLGDSAFPLFYEIDHIALTVPPYTTGNEATRLFPADEVFLLIKCPFGRVFVGIERVDVKSTVCVVTACLLHQPQEGFLPGQSSGSCKGVIDGCPPRILMVVPVLLESSQYDYLGESAGDAVYLFDVVQYPSHIKVRYVLRTRTAQHDFEGECL